VTRPGSRVDDGGTPNGGMHPLTNARGPASATDRGRDALDAVARLFAAAYLRRLASGDEMATSDSPSCHGQIPLDSRAQPSDELAAGRPGRRP